MGSCRRDLLDHMVALNERHLKRSLLEYVRYHHEDRTHLGLEKETPDRRIRSVASVGSFHRSDSEGCTIVTIEPPSSDRVSAGPLYMCPPRARGLTLFKAFLHHQVDRRLHNYSTKNRSISGLG